MPVRDLLSAAAGVGGAADPYFYDVSLLLTGDGTNGAQNNTFLDSSSNNFTITRNGNTTQGTFSPYGNLWSNYFDGSGDWINTGANTALSMGTGDFTWECWVNVAAQGAYQVFIDSRTSAGSYDNGYFFGLKTGTLTPSVFKNGQVLLASSSIVANTWNHVALVRSSGVLTIYINGTSSGSVSDSTNLSNNTIGIASLPAVAENTFTGYISNVRIVKGTALYTSNFTPSTTPLTAVSGTSLLTCQSNRFIDNSSNNFTLTVNGDTKVQRFSPFNPTAPYSAATIGGSGYFDGTGDYLTISGGVTNNGTGDLCFEFWSFYTGTYSAEAVAFDSRTSPFNNGFAITSAATSGYWTMNFTVQDILTSIPVAKNTWQHVALTRSGNTFRLFIDGVLRGTVSSSNNLTSTTNIIGAAYNAGGAWPGYMSNVRCIKGSIPTEYQTSSTTVGTVVFTPPTSPVTAVSGTSLLTNFTNAGIPDAAMMNDLETVGNAQVSTSVKKYGTGSLYFDGTGDYLALPVSPNFAFGTSDFTFECWAYFSSVGTTAKAIFGNNTEGGAGTFSVYARSTSVLRVDMGTTFIDSTNTFSINTWYHIAVVRSGSTVKSYVNGVEWASGTASTNITTNGAVIGRAYTATDNYYFNGYIDDLRITKGYARYITNFTPPTAAFPTF